jgi:hypothetical protein
MEGGLSLTWVRAYTEPVSVDLDATISSGGAAGRTCFVQVGPPSMAIRALVAAPPRRGSTILGGR